MRLRWFLLVLGSASLGQASDPMKLVLTAPIATWDEAIPLGNGLTGGLLWGGEGKINLSLDRGDLWDERLPEIVKAMNWNYATMKRLVAEKNQAEMVRLFDDPYNEVHPTKLPGGRVVIRLGQGRRAKSFELDMRAAAGKVVLDRGGLEAFFSAVEPIAMVRVTGAEPAVSIVRPAALDKLGYASAESGSDGGTTWMVQKAEAGLVYAIVVSARRTGDVTDLALAITASMDGVDPLAAGRERTSRALATGYEAMAAAHGKWWRDFWAVSAVMVPNERIQRHYNLVRYLYGAGSRSWAPPMPLQGVWTADDGNLPPWKGDYHHDLNTQMTYLAYHTAGLTESGLSFVNFNRKLLSQYRKVAKEFYGVDGAIVPGVASLAGQPLGGWSQYALSPTNGLWVGQTFYLHWKYTMDRGFLADTVYPWLSAVGGGVANLLAERGGKLYLPLSSSPEINDNSLAAWLTPNTNYDLALMRWAFAALSEMAMELNRGDDARRWRGLLEKLDDLDVDSATGALTVARGMPFPYTHRHFSHAMAVHPLGLVSVEGGDRERRTVEATLDQIAAAGTAGWCGYSFSWFSCMLARAGRAEKALDYLVDYERAFILRNGFHANGDQTGSGLSSFKYRPFTLEGNFLAMEAVHEMLLQSWGGVIRVFPATSSQWVDASFRDLRAQGGFKVSARREGGRTAWIAISATVDREVRLRDPFPGSSPKWNRRDVGRDGDEYRCRLKAGETLEGRI